MQLRIDVTCIHTNFGGCAFSGFGDIATFKNGQFSFLDHYYVDEVMKFLMKKLNLILSPYPIQSSDKKEEIKE